MEWLAGSALQDMHTSVLCLGEIRRGVAGLNSGQAQARLEHWLDQEPPEWIGPRVLGVDQSVAAAWGRLGPRGKSEPVDA